MHMWNNLAIKIKILLCYLFLFIIFLIFIFSGIFKILTNHIGVISTTLILIVVSFISSYLFSYFIFLKNFNAITKNIKITSSEEADLRQRFPVKSHDEIGIFSRYFNIFIAQMHNIVFKLKNIAKLNTDMGQKLALSSTGISSSIEEITATVTSMENREQMLENHIKATQNDVSDIRTSIKSIVMRIDEQAASISESSAAIEETIASINNLNSISEAKKELITSLMNLAKDGEDDMKMTLESIKNITEAAGMIRELIVVIKNLAAQTNLLAMNAAIEAAHAGKYGSGFSVVSGEIRALAETTAINSKDITKNLNTIIMRINESANLTGKTDESIKMMIEGIQDMANSMNEIIGGLNEMSTGTGQITASLGDLYKITEGVKTDSKTIDEKSQKIDDSMKEVTTLSEQSNTSMKEFSIGINEIKKETNAVAQSGNINFEYTGIMENILNNFKIIDTSNLLSSDGQSLVQWNKKDKKIPARSENPEKFPENNEKHWHDIEYAGWGIKKENIPESPADGAKNKYIICFQPHNHPYQTAYERGIRKIAEAFEIKVKFFYSNSDFNLQKKQVDMAIKENPNLIVLAPVGLNGSTELFQKINNKGIPVIASNLVPENEAFKSILAMTGPDDWMQSRMVARKFAELMNNNGGYCLITHIPGSSCYYGRAYGVITELKKVAPDMNFFEMKYTEFKEDTTREVVSKWIAKYGTSLKGIVSADDSSTMLGVNQALKELNREDIIRVAIGNSKIGLDFIKDGNLHATSYQSAEGDGALSIEVAIDWFNGLDIVPIRYLPTDIITKENVGKYYPPQW